MKKPVILMLHLVVQWLYLASAQSNYPLVTFSTDWVTPEKYNSFIASVRAALVKTTKEKSNGIPVLISKDDPPRYLNVTLTNKAGQSISLKMDVSEAKFTDYVAGKYSCSIRTGTCFSDPFSSSVANTQRESSAAAAAAAGDGGGLGLGAATWRAKDLDEAISSLFLFAAGRATEQSFRRGVATCEMMIASAAKFRYIQRRLGAGMWDGAGNGVSDDPSLHGLLARWPTLSSQVQLSNQGAFPAPVTVDRSNGKTLRVDNVLRAVPIVSFLEHDKCGKKAASSSSSQRYLQVIRSVVQEAAAAELAACTAAEPTMHIVGAEGKCVDVPYSWYVKGTQVILWPCRSNDYDDMNQLWTLKRDGTITINGGRMCLRASSASAGDRVVIDNCWTISPREHKIWDVRADGTIALRSDGSLVLAATSTADGTGLTLERADGGGTGQAWTPTNDTAPLATAVLGYRDLYLQVDAAGAVVLAAPCGGAAAEWALYPDGSIRRGSATQQCLAPDAAGRVVATACSVAGAARQRWVFRNDGTVFNSGAGKVMNVRPRLGAQPGCVSQGVAAWEVVVSEPAPGSPTQEWVIMV